MLITGYEYTGSDYADGIVHDYSEETSYYACDNCGDMDSTLYIDGKKHYCAKCLVERNLDDFVRTYFDEMVEQYAEDYVQGYDVVEQE